MAVRSISFSAAPYLVGYRVNPEIGKTEFGATIHLAAADQSLDTGEQLGKGKRFGQVIVRTGFETDDNILDRILGGQHQHRSRHLPLAEFFEKTHAVALGEHPVEDDEVKSPLKRHGESLFTIGSCFDFITLLFKSTLDKAGNFLFIFNDQNFHFFLPVCLLFPMSV